MSTSFMLNFIVVVYYSMSLASALTSLVAPICKDLAKTDPENVCYDTCVSTLESDPRSKTSTALQLAQISFELSISKAEAISSTLEKRLKFRVPDTQAALEECFDVYSRVPGDLSSGLKSLEGEDFDTASARVSATINAADTCRHVIRDRRGEVNALTHEIIDFQHCSAISLGFTKLLRIIN